MLSPFAAGEYYRCEIGSGEFSRTLMLPCDTVRGRVADKAMEMRRQGFVGAAMLPMGELEYTGIMEKLEALDKDFTMRGETTESAFRYAASR